MKVRCAARVVLMNTQGAVFLLKAKDLGDSSKTWWMTCGGGEEMGELPAQTAARELAEETGIECEPTDLVGPLAHRHAVMEFTSHTLHQDEVFFGLVEDSNVDLEEALWTDVEKDSIVGAKWWTREELETTSETVYPRQLVELMDIVSSGTVPETPLVLD